MECEVNATKLHKAVATAIRLTQSRIDKTEVCLKTTTSGLFVLRSNLSTSVQCYVDARVRERGKVVLPNAGFLEYIEGDTCLKSTGKQLWIDGDELTTSSTDLDYFNSLDSSELKFGILPNISKAFWLSPTLRIFISRSGVQIMGTSGTGYVPVIAWCKKEDIVQSAIVVMSEDLLAVGKDTEIALSRNHIWLRRPDLVAKISSVYDPWDEEILLLKLEREQEELAYVVLDKNELLLHLRYIKSLSADDLTYKDGLAYLETIDGQLQLSTASQGLGSGARIVPTSELNGDFKLKITPQQYINAIANNGSEIRLSRRGNGMVIYGEEIIYGIAALSDPDMR